MKYWEPPNSVKLLMIIVAVPIIATFGLFYWTYLFGRLAIFRLGRFVLRR